jgi:ABC-type glutathione transport system ATPase component
MTAPAAVAAPPALELTDLEVAYRVRGIWRPVLRGVTFAIAEGESYGLVGESGCGKSTAAFAIVRYLPRNGRVSSGSSPATSAARSTTSSAGSSKRSSRYRSSSWQCWPSPRSDRRT